MTTKSTAGDATTQSLSKALRAELKNVQTAPILQRGEAALRLAGMTVLAIEKLEARLSLLENSQHGTQSDTE